MFTLTNVTDRPAANKDLDPRDIVLDGQTLGPGRSIEVEHPTSEILVAVDASEARLAVSGGGPVTVDDLVELGYEIERADGANTVYTADGPRSVEIRAFKVANPGEKPVKETRAEKAEAKAEAAAPPVNETPEEAALAVEPEPPAPIIVPEPVKEAPQANNVDDARKGKKA